MVGIHVAFILKWLSFWHKQVHSQHQPPDLELGKNFVSWIMWSSSVMWGWKLMLILVDERKAPCETLCSHPTPSWAPREIHDKSNVGKVCCAESSSLDQKNPSQPSSQKTWQSCISKPQKSESCTCRCCGTSTCHYFLFRPRKKGTPRKDSFCIFATRKLKVSSFWVVPEVAPRWSWANGLAALSRKPQQEK